MRHNKENAKALNSAGQCNEPLQYWRIGVAGIENRTLKISVLTRPSTGTAFPLRLRLHSKAARVGSVRARKTRKQP